jgi:dienelactone hydrolase
MRLAILLLFAAVAVVLHAALMRRQGGIGRAVVRWVLLAAALVATSVAGPAIRARLSPWLDASPVAPAVAFDPSGDPLRSKALATQHPEHPFPSGGDAAAVASWQASVRQTLRDRQDLDLDLDLGAAAMPPEVLSSDFVGPIRRTLVRFTSWDGTRIPAYVLDPGGSARKAGVLVVPGHGLGIAATAGFVEEYEHQAALALAQRGYLVVTPEIRGFGMLAPSGRSTHRLVAATALAAGTSYKAVVAKDLHRALTVLEQWPGVDRDRLAVVGTSLGGELSVLLAGLDPRIKVAVANGYGGATGPIVEDDDSDDETGQTPHGCHTMPGINEILHGEDWARLVAPRPLLIVRGNREQSSRSGEYQRLVREAYPSAADAFGFEVGQGGHEFYVENTARFLARWLKADSRQAATTAGRGSSAALASGTL